MLRLDGTKMPSPFPRLAIVLSPEQHLLLSRLSKLQGRSQASYVRQLLDLATPRLRALLTPLEAAQAEAEHYDEGFQHALQEALQEADEELEQQLELLDPLGIEAAIEGVGVGSVQAAPAPTEAPSSNTGVSLADPGSDERIIPFPGVHKRG